MKKNTLLINTLVILSVLFYTACTDSIMNDINENPNNVTQVQAKFTMADIITTTAFRGVGGDFSLYSSIYIEHEVGVHNQMYNAETRTGEPTAASTYNNAWGSLYGNIKNLKIVIEKSSAGIEKGNEVTLGAAKVMLAYNAALAADLFGNTPFSEAGEVSEGGGIKIMQPKLDNQEDIYKRIITLLDEAIVHFDGEDLGIYGAMGNSDFIYQGDAKKWKKAAYGLKARYTMRLLKRSPNVTADMESVLDFISKSFSSAADEFKYNKYNGSSVLNPLFAFSFNRQGLGASKSLIEKFIERNDPRVKQGFMKVNGSQITDPAAINFAPNGDPIQAQNLYDLSLACYSVTAPTQLLSYHEILFLKSEALCRLNRLPEAQESLKSAIEANFTHQAIVFNSTIENWTENGTVDLSKMVADNYFTNNVLPLFNANPLKEVMIQKYLAFWGASGESVETYSDYRRLKALNENFIELKNAKNTDNFPLRFTYGVSDVSANNNVREAFGDGQYVYSESVWWAGGTR